VLVVRLFHILLFMSAINALVACGGGNGGNPASQPPAAQTPAAEPEQAAFSWTESDPASEGMKGDQLDLAFDTAFA